MNRFMRRLLDTRGRMIKLGLLRIPGLLYLYRILKLNYLLHKTGNLRFVYPLIPGHYHSPLPDYKEVLARSQILRRRDPVRCAGIDLREKAQLNLLNIFSDYYDDLPFPSAPRETERYYYENTWFSYADVIILYSVLRHYGPNRVIEVGSGFSSAAMLDVNEAFLDKKVQFTFIEPYPERLFKLFTREDKNKHTVLQEQVQDVPLEVFQALSENDVLFIDSSHVVKFGSDVVHILFDILPELRSGVLVHFHDIFWPFEYPEEWILHGRAWNESYFLRSFLEFNAAFEIIFFNSFIAECHTDILREKMPLCLQRPRRRYTPLTAPPSGPSSLWLKKR